MGADTKKEEGFRADIYKDTKGIKTVGQGFNVEDKVTASMLPADVVSGKRPITKAENDIAYNKRMDLAKKDAREYLGADTYDKLDPDRKSVMDDMSYNMGKPTLSKFEKLREAVQKGDWSAASKEILNSKYAKDVPNRAQRNAAIMKGEQQALEKELLRQTVKK